MPDHDEVSDEHVAQLLAKDARDLVSRSSRIGRHDPFLQRPTINAPKPNTRFLKSIIKETDSHNTALLAKEAQESRARLRSLNSDIHGQHDRSSREGVGRMSKRSRLDRSRSRDRNIETYRPPKRSRGERPGTERSRSPSRNSKASFDYRNERHKSHHAHADRRRDRSVDDRGHSKLHHGRSEHPRHASSRTDSSKKHRRPSSKDRAKVTDLDDEKPRSSLRGFNDSSDAKDSVHMRRRNRKKQEYPEPRDESPSAESDPLESIVGPAPPPSKPQIKARGRGALHATSNSAMDAHFAQNYDPTNDAHPDPDVEVDDWDQALEALRDRQKWQQRGAERLRAAGFSEDEVLKWTKGSDRGVEIEKDEADVRWKGRGESREWDRGKVVTDDGISTQPEWGRLT